MKQTTANKTNSRPAWALWNSTAGTYTRRDIIPGLDWLFRWLDRHPRTAAALLWLQAAALAYVVFTYDFTTRI